MADNFKWNSGQVIQNPVGKKIPHVGFKNVMWVHMTPKHIMSQTSSNRGGSIQYDKLGPTPKYL